MRDIHGTFQSQPNRYQGQMKRPLPAPTESQQMYKRQHLVNTSQKRWLDPIARLKDAKQDSRYNSEASIKHQQQRKAINRNNKQDDSISNGLYEADFDATLHMQPSMELAISHAQPHEPVPWSYDLHVSPPSRSESIENDPPKKVGLLTPAPTDQNPSMSSAPQPFLDRQLAMSEPQNAKLVTKSKGVQKLAKQVGKLSKRREDAINLRVEGRVLRNEMELYRAEADTLSVKLQELLADSNTPRQAMLDLMEELRSARAFTIQLEIDYNKHEELVNEKEYELTEMEQHFSDKYGPVEFADNLLLDSVASYSDDDDDDDDEEVFSDSDDDEAPTSPSVPMTLYTRDKYVDNVKLLGGLRAEQEELEDLLAEQEKLQSREEKLQSQEEKPQSQDEKLQSQVEKLQSQHEILQGLRAQQEDLHHERTYHEIAEVRARMEQLTGEEAPDTISKALEVIRARERELAKQIKKVEDESSQLENAAVAAGEMPSSMPSPNTEEDENITLERARLDRHPLLFPFPDIDQTKLHINTPIDESDLPVGVNDWSLYRLRSTALDVDFYKANSEPSMWSKPSSPLESRTELDQQLSERILQQWHLETTKNGIDLGPLTSDVSDDIIGPAAISQDESVQNRENPKVSEILRHRRLPFPRLQDLEESVMPWWNRARSAPDLDGSFRRDLLLRSKREIK